MKRIFVFIVFTCFITSAFSQKSKDYTFKIQNESLEKSLQLIENKLNLHFSYDSKLIKDKNIFISFTNLNKEQVLLKLFRDFNLQHELIDDKNVIISKQTLNFKKSHLKTIKLKILEKETNLPLSDATVSLESGAVFIPDLSGKITITNAFTNDDTLLVRHMGYEPEYIPVFDLFSKDYFTIKLAVKNNQLPKIVLTLKKNKTGFLKNSISSNKASINLKEIDDIGGLVEKDVLQTIHLLPGINGADESASQFNIRGGSVGQNKIIYDGINLYHLGHYFGKITALNPNFVETVSVYKDYYPSKYSGRVAGVIDIKSLDSLPKNMEISTGASLLSGSFSARIPLFQKKAFLAVGYRKSFSDIINSDYDNKIFKQFFQDSEISVDQNSIATEAIEAVINTQSDYDFSDYNVKYLHQLSSKTTLEINAIEMRDKMNYAYKIIEDDLVKNDSTEVTNHGISTAINTTWNTSFHSEIIASFSKLENTYSHDDFLSGEGSHFYYSNKSAIKDYSIRLLNTLKKEKNEIYFGYEYSKIDEKLYSFNQYNQDDFIEFNDTTQATTQAVFIDFSHKNKTYFTKLSGRLNYNNLLKEYYVDAGFNIGLHPFNKQTITLFVSGGIYRQTMNRIFMGNALRSNDYVWLLSRIEPNNSEEQYLFPSIKNKQLSIGLEKKLAYGFVKTALYTRKLKNITSFVFNNPEFNPYSKLELSVLGAEFSYVINKKHYYSFLSYSFNKTNYLVNKNRYPTEYNKPHVMNLLLGGKYKSFNLSVNYNLHSGNPYTPYKNIANETNNDTGEVSYYLEYGNANSKRVTTYERIDTSLSYKFKYKRATYKLATGILNIFNTQNILKQRYSLRYPSELNTEPKISLVKRMGLPRMYNFSIQFEWK